MRKFWFVGLVVLLGCASKPRQSGPVDPQACLKSMGSMPQEVIDKFHEQPICYLDCDGKVSWHFHDHGEIKDCAQRPRGQETPQR